MNNKGFAISGILYSILVLFLLFISVMLFSLQNKKTILDELKVDSVEAVNFETSIDYLTNKVNVLEQGKGNIIEELNNKGANLQANASFEDIILSIQSIESSDNPYLRYDTNTKYIQAQTSTGNWQNILKTGTLPLSNIDAVTEYEWDFTNGTSSPYSSASSDHTCYKSGNQIVSRTQWGTSWGQAINKYYYEYANFTKISFNLQLSGFYGSSSIQKCVISMIDESNNTVWTKTVSGKDSSWIEEIDVSTMGLTSGARYKLKVYFYQNGSGGEGYGYSSSMAITLKY